MRDGHNGYTASAGIAERARGRGRRLHGARRAGLADRVLITSGTSEGIELALSAIVDEGEDVLVPSPTYPLYTAVLAKIGAHPVYYRTDPASGWLPDLDHMQAPSRRRRGRSSSIDPNNPTGAVYPEAVRRAADRLRRGARPGDPRRRGLRRPRLRRPGAALAALAPDAAIISYSSLSKAYLAPGWRAGWMAVGATPRLDDALAAIKKLADGRLCSPGPMQYAVTAALTGDRSHQVTFRAALRERARPDDDALQRHAGHGGAWRRRPRSTRCRR